MSREDVIVAYCLAFDCDDDQVNYDFVDKYTGHSNDEVLTTLRNDPSYQTHKKQVNAPAGFEPVGETVYRRVS